MKFSMSARIPKTINKPPKTKPCFLDFVFIIALSSLGN
jgi:hypothetical protein